MKNNGLVLLSGIILSAIAACNHQKPKPASTDITKTAVAVNGKKDSVINNPEKNYGNATVSEPCVKCLLAVIQNTGGYKAQVASLPASSIIYKVNWIISTKPVDLGNGSKITNGMAIEVNQKAENATKNLKTYLYNNAEGKIYITNDYKSFHNDDNISDSSLKKIRNSCFWGVASSK